MGLSSKQVCNDDDDDDLSKSLLDLPNSPSTTKEKVQQLEGIDCPRCGSNKTKFCYYNNYNKSQPRHFCKACKRHWTKGGTLRKVPIGGGRKNKRLKITPYSASNAYSAAVPKASSTTNMNIPMNHDCHEFHLGAHQGLKDMTEDEKNISHNQFEIFIDDGNHRNFTFSGLDSFQFDGNIFPSNYTSSSSSAVFSPAWQSGGVVESMPNCWNLNDLDSLISTDLNVSWPDDDDAAAPAQIDPGP